MPFKTIRDVEFVAFLKQKPPTITGWNRLEGRPRSENLDNSLSFEICDALWMLTRQLQMNELHGEDAASPVSAKIKFSTARLDQVRLGDGPVEPYDDNLPLEVRAEREHPPLNLRFALEAGRLWTKYLAKAFSEAALSRDFFGHFLDAYPIAIPAEDPASVDACAYQPVYELFAAAAGRAIDGAALYSDLASGLDPLAKLVPAPTLTESETLHDLLKRWFTAMRARYALDAGSHGGGWRPPALEYAVSCSAPGFDGGPRIALVADEYGRGHLDWYSFDVGSAQDVVATPLASAPPPASRTEEFIPTGVRFPGMPAPRLWEFENRKTNFGKITAHTTDLARLVFIEFGLAYGNDWFLFPLETEVARLLRVDGLIVTNTFGERIWIPAFGQDAARAWERWGMYINATAANQKPESRLLFVPDAIASMLESEPLEKVRMFRDEVANMVFAVENRITLEDGRSVDGFEAFQARRKFLERFTTAGTDAPAGASGAPIAYKLMIDNIPENWIPFIPVRMPQGNNREIQLQRAALLRKAGDGTPQKVPPRTQILRPGYPSPYFVHEEEVPRTGIEIVQTYQRTRHHSGRPIVWCGRSKRMGRGEGSSGLAFDRIIPR